MIDNADMLRADVYIADKDPFVEWAISKRRHIEIGNEIIHVAPPEYVIVQKLQYMYDGGSAKHVDDIRAMLGVLGDGIDIGVINQEIVRRRLEHEWKGVIT